MDELEREQAGLPVEEEEGGRSNRTRLIVLVLVAGLALAYMVYAAFPGNALFFLSVSEFLNKNDARDGRTVRVAGKLVDDSYHREGNSTLSRFQLVDKDGGPQSERLTAAYVGVLPDLFFNPHSEIIVQGSYGSDRVFQADTILVKCPSKYRSIEEGLQDST